MGPCPLSTSSAVPNRRVSLQCPAAEYPCSVQLQSIPAVPNRRVSLQCPTAEYPCSAQPQSIRAVPNRRVSPQCPTNKYPRSAQPQSFLQCPTAEYPCCAQPTSIRAVPNRRVSPIFQETLHLLSNKSFRVGMLQVNYFLFRSLIPRHFLFIYNWVLRYSRYPGPKQAQSSNPKLQAAPAVLNAKTHPEPQALPSKTYWLLVGN